MLNNKHLHAISEKTVKRVCQAVRELDYYANAHAQRLARGRTNAVGLIVSEIADPSCQDVIRGFEIAASNRELQQFMSREKS